MAVAVVVLLLLLLLLRLVVARWDQEAPSPGALLPSIASESGSVPEQDPDQTASAREEDWVRESVASPVDAVPLRVVGTVRDSSGHPVAGADVIVRLTYGEGQAYCEEGARSRADGSYQAVLPEWVRLTEAVRSASGLSGRASAFLLHSDRWQVADLSAVGLGAPDVRLDLTVKPGAGLTGRVLQSDGQPSAGATVILSLPGTGWSMRRSTNAAGEYALPFHRQGQLQIEALHPGQGLSDVLTLYLDPRSDDSAPDLLLHGSGFIEGRAVYPDGNPAARLELVAEPTSDSAPAARTGLRRGATSTLEDGSFRFSGLAAGHYSIGYPVSSRSPGRVRESIPTGTRDVRLTVRHHRARVRVLDEAGEGVPGAKIRFSFQLENQSSGSQRTISASDGVTYVEGNHLAQEPGVRFQVEAWTRETIRASANLPIEEGLHEICIDLVLRQPREHGLLALDVRGPDGERIAEYQVGLHSGGFGRETSSHPVGPHERPFVLRLPPGPFEVIVRPRGEDTFRYFFAHESVEIVGGQRTDFRLELKPAGRIRLRVQLAPSDTTTSPSLKKLQLEPRDRTPWESNCSGSGPVIDGSYLRTMQSDFSRNFATEAPFESMPTPMLWPGWYRLRAEFSGYCPVERDLFVRGRETTDVEIQLVPTTR